MDKKRVVITGVGVVAPNGIGKEAYWKALKEGTSGIRPITVFDPGFFKARQAGEVPDFNAEDFLGAKGLRNMDRSTKLLCSAAKLAITDADLKITEDNTNDIGVVTATTLSVVFNIAEFTKDAETDGPKHVNPAKFPSTTINSPSSQVSIWFKIKGFNATVSTGYTAGIDALKYAVDFIRLGRAKAVLVAGVEALFFQSYVGFLKLDFLAGIKGEEVSCPFDKRRNGIILGEGAGVVVIEDEEYAKARGAKMYAEVKGIGNLFDPFRSGKYNPRADGLKRSIVEALKSSGVGTDEIDYICASANSVEQQDRLETMIIKEVLGENAQSTPVSSIKSMIGEAMSASGVLQIIASVGALEEYFIPPTINYKEPDPACDLDYVVNEARIKRLGNILINNFGPGGNNAACVLSRIA
ncbi:MAG: beta-ketoacyl-[acyl-carrier-protein] synthase family protein [Candidatus Omnitrophota bacterium]|jgi:3-oxoacyl-[acyl-carrier-protein] synthase II